MYVRKKPCKVDSIFLGWPQSHDLSLQSCQRCGQKDEGEERWVWFWLLLYAHRHQSILGVAGHIINTDTSDSVDGNANGAQNMVTVQSGFEPATFRSVAQRAYQLC
jgi:hypothetical protein